MVGCGACHNAHASFARPFVGCGGASIGVHSPRRKRDGSHFCTASRSPQATTPTGPSPNDTLVLSCSFPLGDADMDALCVSMHSMKPMQKCVHTHMRRPVGGSFGLMWPGQALAAVEIKYQEHLNHRSRAASTRSPFLVLEVPVR